MKIKCYFIQAFDPYSHNKQWWCVRGKRLLSKVIDMILEDCVRGCDIYYREISYKEYVYCDEHPERVKLL